MLGSGGVEMWYPPSCCSEPSEAWKDQADRDRGVRLASEGVCRRVGPMCAEQWLPGPAFRLAAWPQALATLDKCRGSPQQGELLSGTQSKEWERKGPVTHAPILLLTLHPGQGGQQARCCESQGSSPRGDRTSGARRFRTARLLGKSMWERGVGKAFPLAEGSGPGWGGWVTGQAGGEGTGKCARERGAGGREACRMSGPWEFS